GGKKLQVQFMAFIPTWLGTPFKDTAAGKTSGLTNQATFDGEVAAVTGTWASEPGQLSDYYFFATDNRGFGGGSHRLLMSATVDSADIGKLASKGNLFTHDSNDSHRA